MQNNKKNYVVNEQSIHESKANHVLDQVKAEAKMSRPLTLRFRSIFSEFDKYTKTRGVWDLWIKFPFRVSNEDNEKFKEAVNQIFKEMFLK